MSDKENRRKCFKCGSTPHKDNIKLFRFPKPGVRNMLRCQQWAQYIFPEKEHSLDFLNKLFSEHRMLCQNHFKDTDFANSSKNKLLRYAFPSNTEVQTTDLPGPSHLVPSLGIDDCNILTNIEPNVGRVRPVSLPGEVSKICLRSASPGKIQQGLANAVTHAGAFRYESGIAPQTRQDMSNVRSIKDTEITAGKCEKKESLSKCKKYMRQVCQLRNRIKKMKTESVVKNLSDDVAVKRLSQRLTPAFARILQDQLTNFKKKATGRRWSNEVKITALRLFKRSPTCYRLLRRIFNLPSPTTLKSMLNRLPFSTGVHGPVITVLEKFSKTQTAINNQYILMFDEMSLKKHLNYNSKIDLIEGYQDHASQGRSQLIAAYALVFMVAGIRKRVKQPIAHYFSSGFSTADRLAVLIKQVLHECFKSGINITATVCDMDGVNRRALTILGASQEHPYITVCNKEIISFFDPPHLLKCFRNLFIKYDIECSTNISSDEKKGRGIAKWAHIKQFYELDNANPNFVYAPALKKDHLNPNTKQKMKVKLAAQVLSHSVAGGMYAKISAGELTADAVVTAEVVANMDKLFDAINSDCADRRRGKLHATNMTSSSPHLVLFTKMKKFFETMKYIGSSRSPPSKEGWIWTLNAFERLWRHLSTTYNIRSLATRRIQQDAIENLFGCIRGNCGSNSNPTSGQFVAGLKTSVLSNLSHIGTTGNCETDNNIIINNFETLLSVQQPTRLDSETDFITYEVPHVHINEDDLNENDSEIQACAYVCGFLIKKIQSSCEICKNIFISENVQELHLFVECREYSEYKKSLNYATKDIVACVESCATIINNFLKEEGHTTHIKKQLLEVLKNNVSFKFLDKCQEHKIQNMNNILGNIFEICIKRFCVLQNRKFAEEASTAALRRKMNIILHK